MRTERRCYAVSIPEHILIDQVLLPTGPNTCRVGLVVERATDSQTGQVIDIPVDAILGHILHRPECRDYLVHLHHPSFPEWRDGGRAEQLCVTTSHQALATLEQTQELARLRSENQRLRGILERLENALKGVLGGA